ncbi:MAG: right-handed parallel beta-helix repeat-containing protein [Carnobacterium sp.]|uniref:right-handed parallel beta-helix repeat-containing protein n=1 Tax=Carnobacterium sp. TaxID=48221 RepID=UPI003314B956
MNGKIIISNCHFEDNGTAIESYNSTQDFNISNSTFINNNKDINLYFDENSNIIMDGNKFIGCKTTSISLNSYYSKLEDIKKHIQKFEGFTTTEKKELKNLINEMKKEKDNPSKIKFILKEIYDFSKPVASGTLVKFIISIMGW